MSGGVTLLHGAYKLFDSVSELDNETGEWSVLPPLNEARKAHSSCASDSMVYVYDCHYDYHRQEYDSSFEKINLQKWRESPGDVRWETFTIAEVQGRQSPLIFAVEPFSLIIVGGHNNFEKDFEDCFKVDTQTG